ncbi:pyrimidine-nucleoside phosphorylase [Tuberibacillus sp. Marseille-P3662]|uniref:pyrimidine-nucleoside phosphorylase n=1 Tax=Tuberibacillus sp. Marseille-P3662 TaxID=1965358 RepID=UPI000A1CE399|nr:pyrimidine-nucleoside phosphorylase [Tuberibacillus sp. Marseille-P3662]
MRMVDLIQKKRDGNALSAEDIQFIVHNYTNGNIPDYQMSAFAMAVYFQGMEDDEIADLTLAMAGSGDSIDLTPIEGIKVDKHSTGGVGDKTSFIVTPLVAAAGVPVAKMSGRGLGHTGGTIDKLEAIEGFQTELTRDQFIDNVNKHKLSLVGQSGNLAPADKKLYALRDVTATVDSIPLIASSIMSKKIASGADAIVLDVKTGSGAFMKTLEASKALANEMVSIGNNVGRNTIAVVSDMNQPLGYEIGNANEIKEAVEVLNGRNIEDLRKLSLELAAHMTVLAEAYPDYKTAYQTLQKKLDNGEAYEAFKTFIASQGGDVASIDDLDQLPQTEYHVEVKAEQSGYVTGIDAESVGVAAMHLGAGRATKDDVIDHAVGITLKHKIGDYINNGDVIAVLHSNSNNPTSVIEQLKHAIAISKEEQQKPVLLYKVID